MPTLFNNVKQNTRWTIEQITYESYKYADALAMSAKKDAMVPMGGLLCFKDNSMEDVYNECRTLCVVQEGFPTYGGLEGGAMERLAVGLRDGMRQDWLAYRISQIEYLVQGLEKDRCCLSTTRWTCRLCGCRQIITTYPSRTIPSSGSCL